VTWEPTVTLEEETADAISPIVEIGGPGRFVSVVGEPSTASCASQLLLPVYMGDWLHWLEAAEVSPPHHVEQLNPRRWRIDLGK
jgi:hypothetical protein